MNKTAPEVDDMTPTTELTEILNEDGSYTLLGLEGEYPRDRIFNKVAPDEVCYCGWDGIDSDGCTCLTAAADIEEE